MPRCEPSVPETLTATDYADPLQHVGVTIAVSE